MRYPIIQSIKNMFIKIIIGILIIMHSSPRRTQKHHIYIRILFFPLIKETAFHHLYSLIDLINLSIIEQTIQSLPITIDCITHSSILAKLDSIPSHPTTSFHNYLISILHSYMFTYLLRSHRIPTLFIYLYTTIILRE
jgi:hypothetical protein